MVKTLKYILLWKQKANGLGTWYVALGMWALPDLHNDLSTLTLTYFMARSNLIPNAFFMGKILNFLIFLLLFRAKS